VTGDFHLVRLVFCPPPSHHLAPEVITLDPKASNATRPVDEDRMTLLPDLPFEGALLTVDPRTVGTEDVEDHERPI